MITGKICRRCAHDAEKIVEQRGSVLTPPSDGEFNFGGFLNVAIHHALKLKGTDACWNYGYTTTGGHQGEHRGGLTDHLGDARLETGLAANA